MYINKMNKKGERMGGEMHDAEVLKRFGISWFASYLSLNDMVMKELSVSSIILVDYLPPLATSQETVP